MIDENNAPAATDGEDTSAVLAALNGDKTYLPEKATADPDQEPEQAVESDTLGDEAPAAAAEGEAEQPKPKKTAQERFDELTRARRDAERDAEYWKAKALGTTPAQPAPAAQDTPQGDGRPNPADYDNDADYIEDLTDWKAEQAVERRFAQRSQTDQIRSTVQTFETRTKTLFPGGDPAGLTAFKAIPELPVAVMEVVGASDIGPKLAAHLGDNPAELARLATLSPSLQARELTLLETRLAIPPKPTPKTATDAPEPPPQARGQGGQFKVAADTDDFAAFEKQYRIEG